MATQGSQQAVRMRVRAEAYDELAVIAQRAQALTNAAGAAIALSEGDAAEIICRARAGSSAPEVGTALPVEETFTGLCIQSGRELRCDDAETDARVDQAAICALGIRSMVVVPINEEGRVVGVLAVFASTAHAFSFSHVAVLKTIADQVADYLHRALGDEAYSRVPLPTERAVAVSAAASPVPPSALTQSQLPVVPRLEPVPAATANGEIDPASLSQEHKKDRNSRDLQKKSKTDFWRVFGTLLQQVFRRLVAAAAVLKGRARGNLLMVAAVAAALTAVAVGFSFKLRRPTAAAQPALEASSSPATPAAVPNLVSANVLPPAKNAPPTQPAERDQAQPQPQHEAARPKREEKPEQTVVLAVGPSRIAVPQSDNSARVGDHSGAKDNLAPGSDALPISLDNVPASQSLSDLVSSASPAPHPRFLPPPSELEPVKVIKRVPPVYPLVAKQTRLSSIVVVQGTVNKNGRIGDLQLISGSPLFREAAFTALKQWIFKPARLNGQAIEQSTTIRLDFGVQ